jgi:hypothetical protein
MIRTDRNMSARIYVTYENNKECAFVGNKLLIQGLSWRIAIFITCIPVIWEKLLSFTDGNQLLCDILFKSIKKEARNARLNDNDIAWTMYNDWMTSLFIQQVTHYTSMRGCDCLRLVVIVCLMTILFPRVTITFSFNKNWELRKMQQSCYRTQKI